MEREADRVGYGVMAQAGFEPQGFVSMFEKLQQASRLNDTGGFPYLRSHPLTTERIADMQARHQLQASRVAQAMSLEHALVVARARALSLSGQDALRNLLSQARAGQNQPTKLPQQAGNLYAAVLAAIELRDLPQAQSWFDQLRALVRQDTAAERLVRLLGAELALKRDQPERALEQLAPLRQQGQSAGAARAFFVCHQRPAVLGCRQYAGGLSCAGFWRSPVGLYHLFGLWPGDRFSARAPVPVSVSPLGATGCRRSTFQYSLRPQLCAPCLAPP